LLLGLLALATLPREEEPQIRVPMVDVRLAWPGTPVAQVERQLTTPVERRLWEIPGLEYLYSTSTDDGALLIARQTGFGTECHGSRQGPRSAAPQGAYATCGAADLAGATRKESRFR